MIDFGINVSYDIERFTGDADTATGYFQRLLASVDEKRASEFGDGFAGEDLNTASVALLTENVIVKRVATASVNVRRQQQAAVLHTYTVDQ